MDQDKNYKSQVLWLTKHPEIITVPHDISPGINSEVIHFNSFIVQINGAPDNPQQRENNASGSELGLWSQNE